MDLNHRPPGPEKERRSGAPTLSLLAGEGFALPEVTGNLRHRRINAEQSGAYTSPNEANAVTDAQPRATPSTAPASTSLRKCMPRTIRETAMLTAKKNSGASSPG